MKPGRRESQSCGADNVARSLRPAHRISAATPSEDRLNRFQPSENRQSGFTGGRLCRYLEMPQTDYTTALELQRRLVADRLVNSLDTDVILILEHPPVFTLGRRGGRENLMVSRQFLEKSGVPVVHVERGGNITYHGPGQVVGYPIINLRAARLAVKTYVHALEEVMRLTALDWGIAAERNPLNRGLWVGDKKMGSIGIAVRHGVAFHGFAFNVNLSLTPFEWINPCGLEGVGVTSLARELAREAPIGQVRRQIRHHLEAVLEIKTIDTELPALQIKDMA